MKRAGIWIDRKVAIIIELDNIEEEIKTTVYKVENLDSDFSGSKDYEKGGAQEIVKDRKGLEIKKHAIKGYFEKIISHLKGLDSIVIYGPAEMPMDFNKELETDYPALHKKVLDVIKADSMTDNQVKAMVKNYYKV